MEAAEHGPSARALTLTWETLMGFQAGTPPGIAVI